MRLIDADELLERLYNIFHEESGNNITQINLGDAMKEINESKAAYDVDKVVEQLQKLSDNCWQYADLDQRSLGKARAFDKAIEIIKDGGKNDN